MIRLVGTSPSIRVKIFFQFVAILSTATIHSLFAFALTEANLKIAVKKVYKFDKAIKVRYNIPNVDGTNYVAIYKKASAVEWGTEAFWMSLCDKGDQNSWPCDPPAAKGNVLFSVKDPYSNGGDGTNWPPPKGKYKACLLNRNEADDEITQLKCKSFIVQGAKGKTWKKASVEATKGKFDEGEAITLRFRIKKNTDAATNQFVGLYKSDRPTVPSYADPITWVYIGCNNQEGNQSQTKYCSIKKKNGSVSIIDSAVKGGKYFACLIFDNNKPYKRIKCSKRIKIMPTTPPTGAPAVSPTSAPTGGPTSVPTSMPTSSPTSSPTVSPTGSPTPSPTGAPTVNLTGAPTTAVTAEPTTTLELTDPPTPANSFVLAPWIQPSDLAYIGLGCNADAVFDINSQDCVNNAILFSTIYDSSSTDPLTVTCGQCVVMDYTDGSTLEVPGGLHVLGRLHFDKSSNVIVRTTGVFVQGSWSMDIPNEGNQVKILLHGFEEQTLYPHDLCCTGNIFKLDYCDEDCEDKKAIGKKPFVVAGGKLDIRAVDPTCKSWTKLEAINNDLDTVTLDVNFAKCLRPGDDLLFTSDTRSIENESIRKVASVDKGTGVVVLQTAMPYLYPTLEGPGESYLASEVALLRRDVVFEAELEPQDEEIGGHSIVFHTPLMQVIQGVQFENFGQAGVLGRYPIHFHKSGDSRLSLISKNLIINSNQRCIFIHNTNYVTIDDNVAYNTAGHCYATETGAEHHNLFSNNLGARTKKLWRSNGQSDSAEGFHKHQAATFWLRNMENTFVGNVVAGSESMGFWIEMPYITGNQLNSGSFRNNVAHACYSEGLITYKKGWKPINPGVIDGFISYNNKEGAKFHITGNIVLTNFLFLDNVLNIRYGAWNDGIVLENSSIVALSQDNQRRRGKTCSWDIGIEATFNDRPVRMGQLVLHNVSFVNFVCNARILKHRAHNLMEDDMGDPFQYKDVVIIDSEEDTKPTFDCDNSHWQNVFMEDSEGVFGPAGKGAGFLIQNNDRMKTFLPDDACEVLPYDDKDQCTAFCAGICIRLVHLLPVGRSSKIGYKVLKLTHSATGKEHTFTVLENGKAILVLPPGQYEGDYIDVNGDSMALDTVDVQTFRAPKCDDFTLEITFPTMPPTVVPTAVPTKTASPSYSSFYREVGENVKCPNDNTRLFKTKNNPHTVDECNTLCFKEPGCEYFSVVEEDGACIGCTLNAAPLPSSTGIKSFQMVVSQWFSHAGDDLKCPYDESRLFKVEVVNIVDCWRTCYDRPGCDYFTHNVENGECMGCDSDALPFQSDVGYQSYRIKTYNDTPYVLMRDKKCPYLDRFLNTETSTRDECWQLCVDQYGCVSFTYGEGIELSSTDKGKCMLCKVVDSLDTHVGFNTYELKK